jgi:membrane-associated phospholipid phosphatase
MDEFLRRYDVDTSAPTLRDAARDLLRRALAPAVALWAGIVGLGLLIVGPLDPQLPEEAVNEDLVATRTPTLNTVTSVMSNIGGTEFIIAVCLVGMALLWWRTRRWWFAVVPGLAVGLQALLFVTSSTLVDRERPEVPHLDESPPTSGYPSGHAGASTAFYLTIAMLSQRIAQPVLRVVVTGLCLLVPLLVSFARLYRGMHFPSDVVVGLANGFVCAWLAWRYLRRERSGAPSAAEPDQTRAYRARTNE